MENTIPAQTYSLLERLLHSTMRLDVHLPTGKNSSGTAFFLELNHPTIDDSTATVLVTCKHVIDYPGWLKLWFKVTTEDGRLIGNDPYGWKIESQRDRWLSHPDSSIDLAILPLDSDVNFVQMHELVGYTPFYVTFLESQIPTKSQWSTFNSVLRIALIGYPKTFMDASNNLPITYHGYTSSLPYADYKQTPSFLMDLPSFPSSSGGPVVEGTIYADLESSTGGMDDLPMLYGIQNEVPTYYLSSSDIISTNDSGESLKIRQYIDQSRAIKSYQLLQFKQCLWPSETESQGCLSVGDGK